MKRRAWKKLKSPARGPAANWSEDALARLERAIAQGDKREAWHAIDDVRMATSEADKLTASLVDKAKDREAALKERRRAKRLDSHQLKLALDFYAHVLDF